MVKPEIKRRERSEGQKIGISRFGTSDDFLLRYVLGQWNLQPDRDVALIQMGGSPETLAGLAAGAIDGGLLASPLHLQAAKFGYHLLADLSTIGIDYQGAGVVTTRSYMREAPDVTRRYVRAYVEGLAPFQDRQEFRRESDRQVLRITDQEALEETYQHYAVKDYAQSSLSDDQRNSNGARRNRFAHAEGQEPRA